MSVPATAASIAAAVAVVKMEGAVPAEAAMVGPAVPGAAGADELMAWCLLPGQMDASDLDLHLPMVNGCFG